MIPNAQLPAVPSPGDVGWNVYIANLVNAINTYKADAVGLVPPVGYSIAPQGITGTVAGAPVYQTQYFMPIDIGPLGWNCDGAVFNLATAYSGATIPTAYVVIYTADPLTGYPRTDYYVQQGSIVLSAAGIKTITWSATPLTTGRYWISFLLTAPAVTTAGTLTCVTSAGFLVPLPAATAPQTVKGLVLTGQTVVKATATLPTAFTPNGGNVMPLVQLRRSA